VTKSVASKPPQLITLQTIAAGLFHFLHNFFTILLLLQIGLIAGESESAKAKLLEIIFPAVFAQTDKWILAGLLLLARFISTYLRNFSRITAPFNIQSPLNNFWISGPTLKHNESKYREISNYAKAFFKGIIIWWADVCFLLVIFLILLILNKLAAIGWVLFFTSGMVFRRLMAHFFIKKRHEWKTARSKLSQKFKFLLSQRAYLNRYFQWRKEKSIYQRRQNKTAEKTSAYAREKAFTGALFPAALFGFIFILAFLLKNNNTGSIAILQIVLIIIYSQSALMRCFSAPAYWKTMRTIKDKWYSEITHEHNKQNKISEINPFLHKYSTGNHNINSASFQWDKMLPLFFDEHLTVSKETDAFFKEVTLLDFTAPLRGETYLSVVLSDKESKQRAQLDHFLQAFGAEVWQDFKWQNKWGSKKLSDQQLRIMYLLRALLHPGKIILSRMNTEAYRKWPEGDIFLNLIEQQNKKLIHVS
jgi:hypothetical protein